MLGRSVSFSLIRALLRAGSAFVIPKIKSKTLRQGLRSVIQFSGQRGYLNVPHYWASYLHDGRGRVNPRYKRALVWYKDPSQDPRIAGGRPVTRRQAMTRRLSSAQFKRDYKAGKLVVRNNAGPTRSVKANPFFTVGMRGFKEVADNVVMTQLPDLLVKEMRRRGIYRVKVRDSL